MALELAAAPKLRGSPRRLGRYELIQLLAKGGMGEVYLARTRGLGGFERLVVIKCALSTDADQPQGLLLAEARLAATLQHTNVVQVYDVGIDGSTVFLAMEYLHGQDVRAIIRRSWGQHRPLPMDQAIAIVIAACAGLHYAHDKRDVDGSPLEIVHRDVSPSNLFVTYDGGVKVIDFGIAKATTLPSETEAGTVKGKLGYMSPEQCRCELLDRRSDVFGLGILLYELTTGQRAFHAPNEYLVNKQILEIDPPRPSATDASYPVELESIVMRALAKQRRDRPPTALALQDELAAFASAHQLDLSQLALGRVMAELFATELAAWQDAQRAGESLVDYVIKRTTTTVAIVAEPVEAARPAATPAVPSRRWTWVAGIASVVAAIGITVVLASSRGDDVRPPHEQAPPPPAPAITHQSPPVLAPSPAPAVPVEDKPVLIEPPEKLSSHRAVPTRRSVATPTKRASVTSASSPDSPPSVPTTAPTRKPASAPVNPPPVSPDPPAPVPTTSPHDPDEPI